MNYPITVQLYLSLDQNITILDQIWCNFLATCGFAAQRYIYDYLVIKSFAEYYEILDGPD